MSCSVTSVGLEHATTMSRVKQSTTEPLRSLFADIVCVLSNIFSSYLIKQSLSDFVFVCLFELILYVPSTIF